VASHRRHRPGAGYVVRDPEHRADLEAVVLSAFTTDAPCRRKANRPPGEAARAAAAALIATHEDPAVVVSLAFYQAIADDLAERGRS
jgi:hypothetical protein